MKKIIYVIKKKIRKIFVSVIAILLLLPFLILTLFFMIAINADDMTVSNNVIVKYYLIYKKWIYNNWKFFPLTGYDGPYIFTKNGYIEEINVIKGEKNKFLLHRKIIYDSISNQFFCQVDNEDKDNFYFSLQKETIIDSSYYNMPSKMIVISDIEGNWNGFYSFLLSNKIIDKQYNWTYDDGHLVLLGDFMDRGKNVIQVLWLIYKLEQEAPKYGGKVHYILGNHEIDNFDCLLDFVDFKYCAIAQRYANNKNNRKAYHELMKNNVLFDWLITKNIITIIGNYLFVHGGISPDLLAADLSIDSINDIGRNDYNKQKDELIFGLLGPLWYRGMVRTSKTNYYQKISKEQVDKILQRYNVTQIVVGHTPVSEISYDDNVKILRIDVNHGKGKFSGKTSGVLIENNMIFKINDLGEKFHIEMVEA